MNKTLITISITPEDKKILKFLKEKGVNISFLCRNAIREAYKNICVQDANLQSNKSN
jgi:hypothetical protein